MTSRFPRALALGVGIVLACAACDPDARPRGPLQAGDRAPEYGARSLAGDSISLGDFRGRPVLLNVWATWCAPCREEMPELQELFNRYEDRLAVLGVSVDRPGAEHEIVRFVDGAGVDFPILLDPDQRIVVRFTTLGVPETFLIDRDGVIRGRWTGQFHPLAEENLQLIEDLLEATP